MEYLKESAKLLFLRTLKAIEPGDAIRSRIHLDGGMLIVNEEQIPLDAYHEVVLIGMGKASLKMGAAAEALLGDRIKRGILVTDRRSRTRVKSEVVVAGHPLPDGNSLVAGEKILNLLQTCGEGSLIVFLISGGGSSLVECPSSPQISLEDLRATNLLLTRCGAAIDDINTIRKSLSKIKSGGLGRAAERSKCIGLYISDVNPGDLRSIASNPLLPEKIDRERLLDVVTRYDLLEQLPGSVASLLRRWESPLADAENPNRVEPATVLLLDNSSAVRAAATMAEQSGFRVEVDADLIEGDYRAVADRSIDHILRLKSSFPNEKVCVISGGEVSCSVRGDGIGGRNQEFVLYSAAQLAGSVIRKQIAVLSGGTDGIDGNSKAAGAVADAELVIQAAHLGLDASIFISSNDSHSIFRKVGGLIVTGPTGNNVRDLRILMAR